MWIRKQFEIQEAARQTGIEQQTILTFIEREWIVLAEPERCSLDEEDIARLRLIVQLRDQFGVNDEGIPIILHLLDQLLRLHSQVGHPQVGHAQVGQTELGQSQRGGEGGKKA